MFVGTDCGEYKPGVVKDRGIVGWLGEGVMLLLMDCQFTTKFELRVTTIGLLKFLNILCRYLKTVTNIVKSENIRIRSVEQQN